MLKGKRKYPICSYLHTAMRSICKRLNSVWLYSAVAFLALANMIGACSWNQETACRKPTLTGTGTVALRLIEARYVELEVFMKKTLQPIKVLLQLEIFILDDRIGIHITSGTMA